LTLRRAAGTAVDTERRAALNGAKLAALVAERWGRADRVRGAVGATATLADGASGWVLPDGDPARALGPALAWADRHGVVDLHLVADAGPPAGVLARHASLFVDGPTVWAVEGSALAPEPVAPAPPAERLAAPAPPELVDLLLDAGVEVVVEGGLVRGEINGLEVARIVQGTTTAGVPIDQPLLEVGVGKADRELTAMVHGALAPVDQLARVTEIVRANRRPDAPRHPLNQLVPERWLRAVLCRDPGLVGLATLGQAEGARARANLAERDIAVAAGETSRGEPVVVACSVGIALDLVPSAADARLTLDAVAGRSAPARLLLAVPERDDHPRTRRVAERLRVPADVVPIPGDWRAAA
jgi:hypothetical protein